MQYEMLAWDKHGGLLSILRLLQMNTTSRSPSAQLNANWKSREVFPLQENSSWRRKMGRSVVIVSKNPWRKNYHPVGPDKSIILSSSPALVPEKKNLPTMDRSDDYQLFEEKSHRVSTRSRNPFCRIRRFRLD